MPEVLINDPSTGAQAKVTSRGQLIVAPLEFSDPIALTICATCTAFSFFAPRSGKQLVVTDIFIHTNRAIGNCGAIIDVYEASSATSTAVTKQILKADVVKQTVVIYSGLNFLITQGVWLNVKTDDATVLVTVAGYFIDT
jgi:hypothetical protein